MSEKTKGELLQEKLFCKNENAWKDADEKAVQEFCEPYKEFLNAAKTEREAVCYVVKEAESHGYEPFDRKKSYKTGDKVYINNRGKAVALIKFGSRDISEGMRITAAHLDSPRLDMKPNPLYEEEEFCYLKTHYYGGIRKYQWPSIPLALHGVIVQKNGNKISVSIGEDENDPRFAVNDLLPHLGRAQEKKPMAEVFSGEVLNVMVGSIPFKDDKASQAVKLNIMNILFEKYGITESDFLSAELCAVPAFKAVDVGFDRSLIGSYGQDDRVCAYTAYRAMLDNEECEHTAMTLLVDKEEIGSEGSTGLQSDFLRNIAADLGVIFGVNGWNILENSKCMSADVSSGFDPNYPSVFEKRNCALVGHGTVMMKYTGSGGKYDTNDAPAEYMAFIRELLDSNGVAWQTGELGAVDAGGGGTVAKFIANLMTDTVDVGVPVLAMHSPFEVTSKVDVYMTYRAFCEFIK